MIYITKKDLGHNHDRFCIPSHFGKDNNIKVGDYVFYYYYNNLAQKISGTWNNNLPYKLVKANKLNKKLYPERIVDDKFLIIL